MTQDEIYEMVEQSDLGFLLGDNWMMQHELESFAKLVEEKATEKANARANASWTLMCKKMVAIEREAYEHDMEVLMNALWKACGDDAEVVNATIESQGELTRARGEQA